MVERFKEESGNDFNGKGACFDIPRLAMTEDN
jgi:hypothetical protein